MLSRYKKLFLSLFFLSLYAGIVVFATPPGSQYTPGETLDPSCAPGSANCSVLLSSGWGLTGNAGTDPSTNFIGTTDDVDFVIRRNNAQVGRFNYSSNFFGIQAGQNATNAGNSNFFGIQAGQNATNAGNSNFFGYAAGQFSTGATSSNFFGYLAGGTATSASYSNFFGFQAGTYATSASYSNFFGGQAGRYATSASYSNFFGSYAGEFATSASYSNFFGSYAGQNATNASYSNLLGYRAGYTFSGNNIGSNNIIIGTNISLPDAAANRINLGGVLFGTGTYATTTGDPSIVPISGGRIGIGVVSPVATLDVNGDTIISGSSRYLNFGTTSGTSGYGFRDNAGIIQFKNNAGSWAAIPNPGWGLTGNAGTTAGTNFIGTTDNVDLVFKRNNVQVGRINQGTSSFSISLGENAGFGSGSGSFFAGWYAGGGTAPIRSIFIGDLAGNGSSSAYNSNFLGWNAGYIATNANNSNFFGDRAGYEATNASYSNLFGSNVGKRFTGNNIGSNNIIIGTNISLPDATANAINLGGVLFGTGTYATTTGNPSITPVSGGRIGIGVVSPSYTLQVGNSGVSGIVARFQNSTGTCDINPTTTSLVCSSDETLKSNITTLPSSLSLLTELRPVTYTWNASTTSTSSVQEGSGQASQTQVGFIAQEVESILPSLVFTDPLTGLKSLAYTNLIPYTVKAIQDINLSLKTLEDTQTANPFRDAIVRLLESATNGLQKIFVKEVKTEKLCIGNQSNEVCINQEQLRALIEAGQIQTVVTPPVVQDEAVVEETEVEEGAPAPVIHEVLETAQEESLVKDTTTE